MIRIFIIPLFLIAPLYTAVDIRLAQQNDLESVMALDREISAVRFAQNSLWPQTIYSIIA